ncbi:MAG: heterodisulfide reductase-related iron-sulfur binding cluster [Bacteriovoracaceae bacterium]|nr:heterodisulfide reductase-related iron-sulfur binding cluster [Bacteriovoracaceae bacterium]
MEQASREIMWNIPESFKYAMYGLLVVATIVFLLGFQKKISYILQGKSWKVLIPARPNWGNFFRTIFFQGKVTRDPFVGVFHSLIFYGFVILWVATDLVAIHFDTPFKIYKGLTYIIISFLADMAGVAILIGLTLAYYRRYVKVPSYLSATRPKSELFMYGMLASLVIIGFFMEGLRILGTGMPPAEHFYSPVGWFLAEVFQSWNLNESTLAFTYRSLWFFHMINTMAFIASLTWTKFFHIIIGPYSAIFTQDRQGAVLNPMDFTNETVETFGLAKLSELTVKERIDTLSCVECGRCTQVCPANLADKPLNPKTIVTKARDFALASSNQELSLWDANLYSSNELDSCTTCGACMEECPMNIEHVQLIMDLKRYKALTQGDLPPAAADAVNKIKKNGNPWGITQDDRMNWAQGMEVPVAEVGKKIDYLYYVGCAGSYDASNQKVVRDTVTLLKKAGVSFAVMGKTEKCNGDPIRRFGDEYSFFEVAIENIANMRQYSFDKVVTHCPHCLHTIGKEYAKFEDGQFTTIHHTELLADLVSQKKLIPAKTLNEEFTFHDPCYLGRHHGEYDAPRNVLHSIPGLKLIEMEKNKDKALCCGMGGGNMWYELPEGKHVALNRLDQIGETKATKLATSCSFCMINFNSSKGQIKTTENLNIEDVSQILMRSVE